jgi:hypothetical protein
MDSKNQQWQHSVKVAIPVSEFSVVRRWLIENCGRRWTATNYKDQPLNWRLLGQTQRSVTAPLYTEMNMTAHFHFKKAEDMMLFLLVWPGEVLIKKVNECIINSGSDK